MSKETGGPAFPCAGHLDGTDYDGGMTLRDYFAAKAMPEAIIQSAEVAKFDANTRANAARIAYEYADAMLAERSK